MSVHVSVWPLRCEPVPIRPTVSTVHSMLFTPKAVPEFYDATMEVSL